MVNFAPKTKRNVHVCDSLPYPTEVSTPESVKAEGRTGVRRGHNQIFWHRQVTILYGASRARTLYYYLAGRLEKQSHLLRISDSKHLVEFRNVIP